MRVIDVIYAAALAALLGWLVRGDVIDARHPGGSRGAEVVLSNLPAVSASSGKPQPVATAQVDERNFRIFVAGSHNVWSVAVSEDD